IEKLLKICQNLKSLLLIIIDYACEDSTYEQKVLEYGEILLKILISSTLNNMKEIRFCGDFKFSLQALEEFLKKWEGNALSIITSNYIEEDYEELINKYKNNGKLDDLQPNHHEINQNSY
ncbi:16644_t:CDS:2, partial [Rhizophagus irregularis]